MKRIFTLLLSILAMTSFALAWFVMENKLRKIIQESSEVTQQRRL